MSPSPRDHDRPVTTNRAETVVTGVAMTPVMRHLVAAVVIAAVAAAAGCSRTADRSAPSPSLSAGAGCAASRGSNVTTRRGELQMLVHLPPCYD